MDLHERLESNLGKNGLKVQRYYTEEGEESYAGIDFEKRVSKITNPDGSVVFEMKDVEVPKGWSQVATDVLAQKYLRKRGVPQVDESGEPVLDEDGNQVLGAETSIKQAARRLAGTWRSWGEDYGYFDSEEDAQAFQDEVEYMLIQQIAVPNSPQWFNTGLAWAYGIKGEAQGHYYVDPDTGKLTRSKDAYTRPQPHACFIQSVDDDLVNEGGIFDLVTKEARLFKFGSGTGTNFSKLRGKGEPLSGGGVSSGLMSFLKVLDSGAGAIQSGGTTRRAAKMVILDADHPEIEEFIEWKVIEEQKVASLVAGSHINHEHLLGIMKSAEQNGIDPEKNSELKVKIRAANEAFVPLNYVKRVLMLVENGVTSNEFSFEVYDTDFRSEAYRTVGGQNSNNSVRVTNDFLQSVVDNKDWELMGRLNGDVMKTLPARELWDKIKFAAWSSADPGIQYHDTVNEWNTVLEDGEIVGSNPCSEYMFLDETACNLYQINLLSFYDSETGEFDTEAYAHVVRVSTIILEISVLMSQLPSKT
ncbi:MAG: vitamin B12-dependent ribonucleotide reductase, partial [Candidatus Dojkabacteria bacterium]